jgi:hypothetical protein
MNLKKDEMTRLRKILTLQAESYDKGQQEDLAMDALSLVDESTIFIEEDDFGNFYVTKGEADLYPCVVAHLDQVHDYHKDYKVHRHGDTLFAFNGSKQVGIGGDDKCGVFLAIEMLLKYDNVKVAFFQDEEVGCLGSDACDLTFFSDCSFILQGDRNHYSNDFITYTNSIDVCSKEFTSAAKPIYEKYGYKESTGTVTDVGKLVNRKVGVSCVNVACGYLNAHTDSETVSISKLALCLRLFEDLFSNLASKKWEHEGTPYTYNRSRNYYGRDEYDNIWNQGLSKYDNYSFLEQEEDDDLTIDDIVLEDTECKNCGHDKLLKYGEEDYCPICYRTEHRESKTVIYTGQKIN